MNDAFFLSDKILSTRLHLESFLNVGPPKHLDASNFFLVIYIFESKT